MAKANPAARRRATTTATITTTTATKAPPRARVEVIAAPDYVCLPRAGERVLGFSRPTLYRLARKGVPVVVKVGVKALVDVAALRAHIAAQQPA